MNRHRQLAACTVVLLMTVMACPAFAQDVTLRYRWTKGDKLRYRFTQRTSTATTGVPGFGDMTSDQTTTQTFSIVVDDVAADGSVVLRQVFESVRIEVNTPMGKLAFDSDNKDAATGDPFGKFLAGVMPAMIGESVRMRLLPNGCCAERRRHDKDPGQNGRRPASRSVPPQPLSACSRMA